MRGSGSRRFPSPTTCFRIRKNAGGSTPEKSTPRGRKRRRRIRDIIGTTRAPRPPILYESRSGYADFAEADDLIAELLRRSAEQARRAPGADLHFGLSIGFLDAVNGATKVITLPHGRTLHVTIPAGIEDGQILRLRGKGAPSRGEGEAGDALVEISVEPHRFFTRQGDDLYVDLPIALPEAALGAEVAGADAHRERRSQSAQGIEHRRCPSPEGEGRQAARPRGRRIRQAEGHDAAGARPRAGRFPFQLEAGTGL